MDATSPAVGPSSTALPLDPTPPAASVAATYRIEHRSGDAVAVLGYSDDPFAPYTALPPIAMRLIDLGATGVILLVAQATGDVLARRALYPVPDRVAPITAPSQTEVEAR